MRIQTVEIEQQGSLLKVKIPKEVNEPNQEYHERGVVSSFSRQSRKRMIEGFARMDIKKMPPKSTLFITLTYEYVMRDYRLAKLHLKLFIAKIERKFPKSWVSWRMEEQRSGSIHFHIILGNVRFWKVSEAQQAWNEIVGGTALNSLDLKRIKSFRGVRSYVAKYAAKVTVAPYARCWQKFVPMLHVMLLKCWGFCRWLLMGLSMSHIFTAFTPILGRRWGFALRKNIPYAEKTVKVFHSGLYAYLIGVSSIGSEYAVWWQSFTVLSDAARQMASGFERIMLDSPMSELARLQKYFRRKHYLSYVSWLTRTALGRAKKSTSGVWGAHKQALWIEFEESIKNGGLIDDMVANRLEYLTMDI